MKDIQIFMLAFVMAMIAPWALSAEKEKLNFLEGKETKLFIQVVDTEGNPVPDAEIAAFFKFSKAGFLNKETYITDSEGRATICGNCVDGIVFYVQKTGWYKGNGAQNFISYDDNAPKMTYKDGKWLPYGIEKKVVLKKVIEPVPMYCDRTNFSVPDVNQVYGWDLKKNSLVEPYGKGKVADFYISYPWEYDAETGIKRALIFTFPNCMDGYYIVDRTMDSDFTFPYKADENATYEKTLSLKAEFVPNLECKPFGPPPYYYRGYYFNHPLKCGYEERIPETKAIILRTRSKVDANGTLVSAHYSVMHGDFNVLWNVTFLNVLAMFARSVAKSPLAQDFS